MRGGSLNKSIEISRDVFQVGGPDLSHEQDASAFLVRGPDRSVLIDAGAGREAGIIWENLLVLGVKPEELSHLILTHGHVDDWRASMHKLLALEADILCEGHFGIYPSRPEVRTYIEGFLRQHSRWD